jgi:hypothetical protein
MNRATADERLAELAFPKTAVPVRVLQPGEVLAGRSVLLSREGAVVRCNHPPAVNSAVVLELQLPQRPEPLLIHAVVRQAIDTGWVRGFRAEFAAADDGARASIAAYLLGGSGERASPAGAAA